MTKRNDLFLFIFGLTLLFPKFCTGGTLDNWNNPKAYKPRPVLFLHGFNSNHDTWQATVSGLSRLFSKYQPIGVFLETIDFQDNAGSVDTYSDGQDGWADGLKKKISALLANNKYGFYTKKLNLVCHSMGGLAAREFLTNPKYPAGTTDKLILIGVPNLGSPFASVGRDIIIIYKISTMASLPSTIIFFNLRNNVNSLIQILWSPGIEIPEAIKDVLPGSSFLTRLNNRSQPSDVQYYGIYGIIGHFLNSMYFHNYYGGDGVVSERSQLGTERIVFKENPKKITAFHTSEPAIAVAGDNPLLQFLDSTQPEFEITSPNPSITTEIKDPAVHITGKVYKEYLPADSQLIITLTRQEDGKPYPPQTSLLKASDLWIPNNPDSPVAEFDEVVNFPGNGTYEISCQLKNPAGVTSEIKKLKVKVSGFVTSIIVHCHNPEGKEINSIQGVGEAATIYIYYPMAEKWLHVSPSVHPVIKQVFFGNGTAYQGTFDLNGNEYGMVFGPSPLAATFKVIFNGAETIKTVTSEAGQTTDLVFDFKRTEFDILKFISTMFPDGGSVSLDIPTSSLPDTHVYDFDWIASKNYSTTINGTLNKHNGPIIKTVQSVGIGNTASFTNSVYFATVWAESAHFNSNFLVEFSSLDSTLKWTSSIDENTLWWGFSHNIGDFVKKIPYDFYSVSHTWYSQGVQSNYDRIISIWFDSPGNSQIMAPALIFHGGYYCNTITPGSGINTLRMIPAWIDGRTYQGPDVGNFILTSNPIPPVKFSTVPYDLLGTGV